jgi:hypothetical protein
VPTIAVSANRTTVVGIIGARQYPNQARQIVRAAASSVVAASRMATRSFAAIFMASMTIARRFGTAGATESAKTPHTSVAVSRVFRSGTVHVSLRTIELDPAEWCRSSAGDRAVLTA